MPSAEERFNVFYLNEATPSNNAQLEGNGPVRITTPADRWAFAALFPLHDDPAWPLAEAGPLLIRVELGVERGEVGVSIAEPTLGNFISTEKSAFSGGFTTLELTLISPRAGCWLVVRNHAPGGVASQATIHSIRTFLASPTPMVRFKDVQLSGFVPFASLASESQPRTRTDGEVWFDVGAHLGEKTLSFAAQNSGARVYAFEPNLKVASQLMGRYANYIVLPMAVAEQDGSAPFSVNKFDAASSLLPFVPEGLAQWMGGELLQVEATCQVPTIRLDTFLNQAEIARIDYLKVDAQGADLAVLRSLGERLKDVERISLEVQITPVPLYQNASQRAAVIEFLTGSGLELVDVQKQTQGQEENLTFVRKFL